MKGVLIAGCLTLIATPAIAQHQGAYLGASVGQTKADVDENALANDLRSVNIITSGVHSDETDTGFKLFGGYRFNRNFAVEAAYAKLGEVSESATVTSVSPPGNVSAKFSSDYAFSLAAVGIAPITDRFDVFGQIGGYLAKTKLEVSARGPGGAFSDSASDTNTGLTFGVGLQYHFTPNIGVRAEWQQFKDVGTDETGGSGDVNFLSVGLIYHFR